MFERLREVERRNAQLVEISPEERAAAFGEQREEYVAEIRWDEHSPTEGSISGAKKSRNYCTEVEGFDERF